MGAEKHGSKSGGGYVGGLLQLFDWNAKSRKKLFSSKSNLPEQSKQKKRCDGNFPVTRLHLMDEDEILTGSSVKGSSDYSCASSITDEEMDGIKAPGVVARLMGLDSLPTSNFAEPYSTPYFDSHSLQDAHYPSRKLEGHYNYHLIHSGDLCDKMEGPVRNTLEPKHSKPLNRPFRKFQTEILPPKSAKSIPVTHHKLLSPIKSANFIPSENAAHIMEAAARIIGPGPQATYKAKNPVVGSSIPLKVRDLKEKVEAAQKPTKLSDASRRQGESNPLKYLKGQPMNKSWNGSSDTTSLRVSSDSEEFSAGTKSKGKSISLALQAKANVQKREGLNPSGSRNLVGQKDLNEVISSELFNSQSSTQKSTNKKPSMLGASGVLRQNNQKQNCFADRGKLPSKPSTSSPQGRKPVNGDSTFARYKSSSRSAGNSKVVSRRSNSEVIDGKMEDFSSSTRTITRKKRSIDGNFHLEKSLKADKTWMNKSGKLSQSIVSTDKENTFTEASKRKGTDVISFTFTAPLTRSVSGPETFREIGQKYNGFLADYQGKVSQLSPADVNTSKFALLGHNVITGDALSTLLEQKLRELTHGPETSLNKAGPSGTSSSFQDLMPGLDALSTTTSMKDYTTQDLMQTDEFVSQSSSGFSSADLQGFIMKHKFQGMDQEMNKYFRNDIDAKKLLDSRFPSPVSVLQHSSLAESCNSSDTADSITTEGSKQGSSVQAQEVFGITSKKFHPLEADAELLDSASSMSTRTVAAKQVITLSLMEDGKSTKSDLEYVKEILCNIDLMFKDFAMGRAREIINPHLFHQMESRKGLLSGHTPKLRRKVLFDCVTECLDISCRPYAGGGYKTWVKGLSVVRSKNRLAEDVYKEISGWSGMGDCMVDELVDMDMSKKYGRWLDFEIEAFELGVQIESRILNLLLDEVIADIL